MPSVREATNAAFAKHLSGDLATAEQIYDQTLGQLREPDPNVFYGYGTLLASQQRYGLAIAMLEGCTKLYDKHAPAWTNLATCYKFMGRDDEALGAYERALILEPDAPDILAGLSGFWVNKDEAAKCEAYARRALAVSPDHPNAHMHLSLALLEQGRFEEAWPHYDYRWEVMERIKDKRPYAAPKWDGKRVRTLAIHGEQGLGDEILFMSALAAVEKLAWRVVIECAPRLIPLFQRSFFQQPNFSKIPIYGTHAELIAAEGEPDAYVPMGSLFKFVGLPDGRPYLKPKEKKVPRSRPRVGIAWQGGTLRTARGDRTLELSDFAPILNVPGIDFVSVQYGKDANEIAETAGLRPLKALDFDAIQETIEQCDLVITVPQTAVHQAGATGVDCWVLAPKRAAWRYCGETMPWYSSVKLFRQQDAWTPIIETIAQRLRERYAQGA